MGTPEDKISADKAEEDTKAEIAPVVRPSPATIPQKPPAAPQNDDSKKKTRWTNDPGMFFLTLLGLIALVFYTAYTRQLVIDGELFSAEQGRLTRDTMVANSRAWIAPIEMKLTAPLQEGSPIKYRLTYQNTGHSPAEEVVFEDDENDVRKGPMKQYETVIQPDSPDWIPQPTCVPLAERQKAHTGWPFLYPFSQPAYSLDFESARVAGKDILNGQFIQLAKGCFLYNTMGLNQRHSAYCFYLEPAVGLPWTEWRFKRCAFANEGN